MLTQTQRAENISDKIFNVAYHNNLIHELVNYLRIKERTWSRAQKSRSDVRGGGRKPWRQKGTGRARAGSINSPLWRGGGVTFAAKPKLKVNYKMNIKAYYGAVKSIYSELFRTNKILVVDDLIIDTINTKNITNILYDKYCQKNKHYLYISDDCNKNLYLSMRNLMYFHNYNGKNINYLEMIKYNNVIMSIKSLKFIEEWLS
jgi:large subunit ribosomal protein L4